MKKQIVRFSFSILLIVLTQCTANPASTTAPATVTPPEANPNIANPASVNCIEKGGKSEIRDETGGQVGYCIFVDGSECEEWAFLRGECAPGGGQPSAVPDTDFLPIPAEDCSGLKAEMENALGVAVTQSTNIFTEYTTSRVGTGCKLVAKGDGATLPDNSGMMAKMLALMSAQGWTEEPKFQADGPTAIATGFTRNRDICLLSSVMTPSMDANCPSDQPIASCTLTPEQRLYALTLFCARTVR